ncbi:hypothetical protein [Actinomyces israelii]
MVRSTPGRFWGGWRPTGPCPGGPKSAIPGRDAAGKTPVASTIETRAQRGLGGARLPAVSNVSTVPRAP